MNPYRLSLFAALILCSPANLWAQSLRADGPPPEVTVTGNPLRSNLFELAPPASVLEETQLRMRATGTLGETISHLPGVGATYFGPNASRPVIRGLDGDRVRILQNGVGMLDASSLSFDHATTVDPIVVERIEVVRGPAALLYGGSAVGGVVNVIDKRIPRQALEGVAGSVDARLGGAERERAGAVSVQAGNGALALHTDLYRRSTGDLRVPGFQRNQWARENGAAVPYCKGREPYRVACNSSSTAEGGAIGGSLTWDSGHAGLSLGSYRSNYGTVVEPGVRIDMRNDTWNFDSEARELGGFFDTLRMKFGHTDYRHVEFDTGVAQTTFTNRGHEARIELTHRAWGPFSGGAFGLQSGRFAFAAVGSEALIPDTSNRADALFGYQELSAGRLKLALGMRVEGASVRSAGGGPNEADPLSANFGNPRFGAAQTRSFNLTSGSLGAVYRLDAGHVLAANLSYSERAPTYNELFANGPHAATGAYEVGNPAFAKERSTAIDASWRHRHGGHTYSIGAYYHRFADFITQASTGRMKDENGDPALLGADRFNEFVYRQVPAVFKGFEAEGRFTLLSGPGSTLTADARADYVHATNLATGEPLPRVAPLRVGAGLTWFTGRWTLRGELQSAASQRRVPAGERASGEYVLINANAGVRFSVGPTRGLAFVKLTNLGNVSARVATSQLRDIVPLGARALTMGVRFDF